ncbi:MAG: succinylglutamate desuccinylase/aspartoacylase family protein [Candidatus Thorarchaeota archaeon]|jgi:predicted deacylase
MVKAVVDAVDIDPKTGTTLGYYTFGEERPNVFILAAMNGRSATDIYASYLIMKHFESLERIEGSVTFLPVASPLAFRLGAKISPLDSKDLDTVFPGNEYGTVTERTAWEIWRRASQADYIINLRTGWQNCTSHIDAMHRDYIHVRNLASQIGLPYVVQSTGMRGALTTEAAHEGIPVVSVEMRGDTDQVDSQAAVEVREAILNLLRTKDMIAGEKIEASNTLMGRLQQVNVDTEGFFVPTINLGETVKNGDMLGHVQDKNEIMTPFDGAVISLSRINYVFEGDMIARIAAPLSDQWTSMAVEQEEPAAKRRKW